MIAAAVTATVLRRPPAATVVIPSFNRPDCLQELLRRLSEQTFRDFELIVVDDASTDGTYDLLLGYPEVKKLVQLPGARGHGFVAAVNAGLVEAKGEVIVLLNNDAVPDARWLEELLGGLERHPWASMAASKLVARIKTDQEALRMPPVYSDKKLTAEQIATLEQWVAQGAEYQSHWAYVAPKRPEAPAGPAAIDHLIGKKLAAKGLEPVAEADRRTLNRRVSLDLTGLPPMPKDVDAFLADKRPDAYARMVGLMGPAGSGQLTKMVNQICIAGLVQGLAEGLHFGRNAGLDIEKVIGVISKGAAGSWQMENRWKTMIDGDFTFGFAVDWIRKDLGLCLAEANRNKSNLPGTALIDQFYKEVQAMGGGRWDSSSLLARLDRK